jgi:hypothetical protein
MSNRGCIFLVETDYAEMTNTFYPFDFLALFPLPKAPGPTVPPDHPQVDPTSSLSPRGADGTEMELAAATTGASASLAAASS